MVEPFNGFKTKHGGLFLSEEAATRQEVLDDLCEIMPEFTMIRGKLDSNLRALAIAMGPMLALARVPSEGPMEADEKPVAVPIRSHEEARARGFPTGPEMARRHKTGGLVPEPPACPPARSGGCLG